MAFKNVKIFLKVVFSQVFLSNWFSKSLGFLYTYFMTFFCFLSTATCSIILIISTHFYSSGSCLYSFLLVYQLLLLVSTHLLVLSTQFYSFTSYFYSFLLVYQSFLLVYQSSLLVSSFSLVISYFSTKLT